LINFSSPEKISRYTRISQHPPPRTIYFLEIELCLSPGWCRTGLGREHGTPWVILPFIIIPLGTMFIL